MLELLRVRAFAIIDELEAHFAPGFNVLTGETGAGKSILVDALHLVLGGRAQADAVRTGAEEAEVQALFRPRDPAATDARLAALGLPAAGGELVVRRTVQREGRSRAWVNGALATAAQLAQATRGLLDISGQHEHVGLLDAQTHLALLDAHAGLSCGDYEKAFLALSEAERVRARLDSDESARAERASFLRYQLDELEKADPQSDEGGAGGARPSRRGARRGGEARPDARGRGASAGPRAEREAPRRGGRVFARGRGGAGRVGHGTDRARGAVRARDRRRNRRGRRGPRGAWSRDGRAAAVAQPWRGAAAAGADRIRQRVVPGAARCESRVGRRQRRRHLLVRRGVRRHRRGESRCGREGVGGRCAHAPGDLHHAPAADRSVRRATPARR